MNRRESSSRPAEGNGRRSRRGVLAAAAAGALGMVGAETIAQAAPARAGNGDPVLQGADNGFPTTRTAVFTLNKTEFAMLADPDTSGKGSLGVYGHGNDIGVLGDASGTGTGVVGNGGSSGGAGVAGNGGGTSVGVLGTGGPDNGIGVLGIGAASGAGVVGKGDLNGTGVEGTGQGTGSGVMGTAFGTGHGVAGIGGPFGVNGNGSIAGVRGIGPDGVQGQSGTGNGVRGQSTTGSGVRGTAAATAGVGVVAENLLGGTALKAVGTAKFSRSGILTVSAGSSKVTKTGITLTAASLVLATLQQHVSGVYVQAAVPHVSQSSFTIYLSKAVAATTKVAWFVVN